MFNSLNSPETTPGFLFRQSTKIVVGSLLLGLMGFALGLVMSDTRLTLKWLFSVIVVAVLALYVIIDAVFCFCDAVADADDREQDLTRQLKLVERRNP